MGKEDNQQNKKGICKRERWSKTQEKVVLGWELENSSSIGCGLQKDFLMTSWGNMWEYLIIVGPSIGQGKW